MANYNMEQHMNNLKAKFEKPADSAETRPVLKPCPMKQDAVGRAQVAPFAQTTQSKTDKGGDRKIDAKSFLSKKLAFTIEHQTSNQSSTARLKNTDNNGVHGRSNHVKSTLNYAEKSNSKSDVLSNRVKLSKDDVQEKKIIGSSCPTKTRQEGMDAKGEHPSTLPTDSRKVVTSVMKINIRPKVTSSVTSTMATSSNSSTAGSHTLQNRTNIASSTASMSWNNTQPKTTTTAVSGTTNSNIWQTNRGISATTTTNSNTLPIQTNTITTKLFANSLPREKSIATSAISSTSNIVHPRHRNFKSPTSVEPSTASDNVVDSSRCARNPPHPRPRVTTPHSPSSTRHGKSNENDHASVTMRSAGHGGSITHIKEILSKKSSYEKSTNGSWKDRTSRKFGDGKFKNIMKSFEHDVEPSTPDVHCPFVDNQDFASNLRNNNTSEPKSDDAHLNIVNQTTEMQTGVKNTKPKEAWVGSQPGNAKEQEPVTRRGKPVVVKHKPQNSKVQASGARDPNIDEEMSTVCKDSDHTEISRPDHEGHHEIKATASSDGDESEADSECYDDVLVVKGLKAADEVISASGHDWPDPDNSSRKDEVVLTVFSQKPIQNTKDDVDGNNSSTSEEYPYEIYPNPKENLRNESPGSESDLEDDSYDDIMPVLKKVLQNARQSPVHRDETGSNSAQVGAKAPDGNPLDSAAAVLNAAGNKKDLQSVEEDNSDYEIPCTTKPNKDEEAETKWNPVAVTKPFRREKYSRKGRYGNYHLPVTPCDNPNQEINLNKSVGSTTDSGELSDSSDDDDYEPVANAVIYTDVDNEHTQFVDATPLPQVANKGKRYKLSQIKIIQQLKKRVKKTKTGKKGIPPSSSNPNLSALQTLPHNASSDSLDGQVTLSNDLDICDVPICNSSQEDSDSSMSRSADRRSLRAAKPLPALPVEDQPPSLDELPPKLPPKRNPSIHAPVVAPPAIPPRTSQRSVSSDSNSDVPDLNLVVPLPVKRRSREYYDFNSSGGHANYKNSPSSGAYPPYDQGTPASNPRASLGSYIDPSEVASIPEPRPSPKFDQSDPNSWADIEYIDVLDDEDVYGITRKRYHSTYFLEEPLYQLYAKDRNSREKAYMEIDPTEMDKSPTESHQFSDLTATLTRLAPGMGIRTLWSKMPQVANSSILDKITPKERKVQEAIFEIITSEASYLKSLNVVIDHFVKAPEFYDEAMPECILEKHDQHALFSNIGAVRDASERFLEDLEAQWVQNVEIDDIGHILLKHAEKNFNVYIVYCSNQAFQTKKLQELMQRPSFRDAVVRLQLNPACSGLPLDSFLLLPMQRITRLPLLVDTICHRLEPETQRYTSSFTALQKLNGLVKKCNEGVRKMQQTEQMVILKKQIEFKIRQVPLVSAQRFLVKRGDLVKIGNESSNWLPGLKAKPAKVPLYLILFNDLLLVSKKKNNGQFVVTDHCQRNSLELVPLDGDVKQYCPLGVPTGCGNLFLMVLLENHEGKQIDMVLSCSSSAERVRWIDACTPVIEEEEGEKIYEDWDCPQVQAIRTYIAQEQDELALTELDVINVKRKIEKWYEGERLRDGERGWFPAECCQEIINTHVRARNLRQAYRMKSLSIDESNFKGK